MVNGAVANPLTPATLTTRSITPPALWSRENWRQPLLACPAEWVPECEPLVEIGIWWIGSLDEDPFDVDELGVLPHPDAHLSLQIQFVLRCERQASKRIVRAIAKFPRQRDDHESAPRPGRRDTVRQLEPVGSHGFQRMTELQFECPQIVPS